MLGDVLGRDEAGRIARVNTCLFEVFHYRTNQYFIAITNCVDIKFDGVPQILVYQQRSIGGQVCLSHVRIELLVGR